MRKILFVDNTPKQPKPTPSMIKTCLACDQRFSSKESFCDECLRFIDDIRDGVEEVQNGRDDEEFKPLTGYPSYLVSNHGYIMNKNTRNILRTRLEKSGNHSVSVKRVPVGNSTISVPRAVAELFLPNYVQGYKVEHINGDQSDSYFGNLRLTKIRINGIPVRKKTR